MRPAVFAILFLAAVAAVAPARAATSEPVNTFCPVLTDEAVNPDIFADYQGKRVYFCCTNCRRIFLNDPTPYLGNLPQFAAGVAGAEAEEHEHEGEQVQGLSRVARFLGKFHPVAVHYPIALIMVASLAEILAIATRRSLFADTARFTTIAAALGAVLAMSLGWAAGAFSEFPGDLGRVFTTHKWLGTATAILTVIAAVLSEVSRRGDRAGVRLAYRMALFASAALVGLTGYFGGICVYGPEHYAW